jgi:internalin A
VTDAGLAHLAGLTSLQELNLWDTQVTDAGLAHLAGLTSLQAEPVGHAGDGCGAGPLGRAEEPAIADLIWKRTVTDAGLAHLAGLKSLQSWKLNLRHAIGDG